MVHQGQQHVWNLRSVQSTEAGIEKLTICTYFSAYLESLSHFFYLC
jgi:hypothetical protein